MADETLSIVMPVFNEGRHLPATIDALVAALDGSGFDGELIVVNDGSTDGSGDVARVQAERRLTFRLITQPNSGRFVARNAGLAAARGDYILFLDARVQLAPDSLRFVRSYVNQARVWNGHVHVRASGGLADFYRLLAELAWRDYFDDPRTTSFGVDDFDRFPKGMGCFLAPRALLEAAFATFRSRYRDPRMANDDTPILRAVAAEERIHISPEFACTYAARATLPSFLRHAIHRGAVFVDGHGTSESRFFPGVVAFFPLSAGLALAAFRRPTVLPAVLLGCSAAAVALGAAARRPRRDLRTLALVTPLYAIGHGIGMWRGAVELLRA